MSGLAGAAITGAAALALAEKIMQFAIEALAALPAIKADIEALKNQGHDTTSAEATMDKLDAARLVSWADADAALSRAGG